MPIVTKDPRTAAYQQAMRDYDADKSEENKAKLEAAKQGYDELQAEMAAQNEAQLSELRAQAETQRKKKEAETPEIEKVKAKLREAYKVLKHLRQENQEMRKAIAANVEEKRTYREIVDQLKERKKELLDEARNSP